MCFQCAVDGRLYRRRNDCKPALWIAPVPVWNGTFFWIPSEWGTEDCIGRHHGRTPPIWRPSFILLYQLTWWKTEKGLGFCIVNRVVIYIESIDDCGDYLAVLNGLVISWDNLRDRHVMTTLHNSLGDTGSIDWGVGSRDKEYADEKSGLCSEVPIPHLIYAMRPLCLSSISLIAQLVKILLGGFFICAFRVIRYFTHYLWKHFIRRILPGVGTVWVQFYFWHILKYKKAEKTDSRLLGLL